MPRRVSNECSGDSGFPPSNRFNTLIRQESGDFCSRLQAGRRSPHPTLRNPGRLLFGGFGLAGLGVLGRVLGHMLGDRLGGDRFRILIVGMLRDGMRLIRRCRLILRGGIVQRHIGRS